MQPNIAEFPHPELIGTFRQFGPFGIPYQTDLSWFPPSVRDVRAFRVEQWSNSTDRVKRRVIKK
jgi:hypothetical protein